MKWRKSTYSNGGGGACVEVAHTPRVVAVRDSKNPTGPALVFAPATFAALVSAIKAGKLDG